ncbi:MAG: MBL fold metallo-hydrolase [Streptosporangiaceae bacterium]|nr:MBL fold metallo-hydrolase [Streptosporangiaceae bacterium]
MEALIDQPGPIEVRTVGADWEANLSGLLNIKDPKAVQAGLTKRKEPIQIYTHVVRHPTQGFFLVDTGVSRRFVKDPAGAGVGWVLRKYGGIEKMRPQQSTAEIIEAEGVPLKGVFMTHIHLDHVSGFPDIPKDVPVYTGAHEAQARLFLNLIAQGTNNHLLDGRPALQELQFTNDPDGRFDGVNDVFGDGSFFAILTPGHTAERRRARNLPGRAGTQPQQSARLDGAEPTAPEHGRETGSPALSPGTCRSRSRRRAWQTKGIGPS